MLQKRQSLGIFAVALAGVVVGVSLLWETPAPPCESAMAAPEHPLLFAYRGAPDHDPSPTWVGFTMSGVFENTLPAYERATARGMVALDFPVRLTSDDVLVVIDDAEVVRTTDGEGQVSEMTAEAVALLNAGGGARVPTAEQLLDLYADRVGYHIRIPDGAEDAEEVAEALGLLLKDHPARNVSWVASNNLAALTALRSHVRGVRTVYRALEASTVMDLKGNTAGACLAAVELPVGEVGTGLVEAVGKSALVLIADGVQTKAQWADLKGQGAMGALTSFTALREEAPTRLPAQGEVETWE